MSVILKFSEFSSVIDFRDAPEFLHTHPQVRPEVWWPNKDTGLAYFLILETFIVDSSIF